MLTACRTVDTFNPTNVTLETRFDDLRHTELECFQISAILQLDREFQDITIKADPLNVRLSTYIRVQHFVSHKKHPTAINFTATLNHTWKHKAASFMRISSSVAIYRCSAMYVDMTRCQKPGNGRGWSSQRKTT